MKLGEIATLVGAQTKGDPGYPVLGVGDIERLSSEQALEDNRLYFIESPAVLKRHPVTTGGGAVLTNAALAEQFEHALVAGQKELRLVFIKLLTLFDKTPAFAPQVHPRANVDPSARVAADARILAGATVMEGASVGAGCILYPGVVVEPFAEVGDGTVLYPNVVVGHHCRVGKRCILHGGTVIGADGFGFYDEPGKRHKIPQIGDVVIDDDVEIGASCTVDRATIESTRIGQHTKIDDQVHVGHNCQVGRYIYIVGNSAVGGSVTIGDGAMISGMVIIKDHVKVAKGSIVMGMSAVAQDTEPDTAYFGTPARPARQTHKMNAALERLPDLLVQVRRLTDKIEQRP